MSLPVVERQKKKRVGQRPFVYVYIGSNNFVNNNKLSPQLNPPTKRLPHPLIAAVCSPPLVATPSTVRDSTLIVNLIVVFVNTRRWRPRIPGTSDFSYCCLLPLDFIPSAAAKRFEYEDGGTGGGCICIHHGSVTWLYDFFLPTFQLPQLCASASGHQFNHVQPFAYSRSSLQWIHH